MSKTPSPASGRGLGCGTSAFGGRGILHNTNHRRSDHTPLTRPAAIPKIEYMSSLADIIAQETEDGRLIVQFLVSAMEGELTDFQPCHRIDAATSPRQTRLSTRPRPPSTAPRRPAARNAQRAPNRNSRSQAQAQAQSQRQAESESQSATNSIRAQLAQIVREETGDGYITVQFLIDAMQGEFPDFKPCHRLSAAKELLQRGFDYLPDDPDSQAAAEPEPVELTPEEREAQRHAELLEFSKHGPVYYQKLPLPLRLRRPTPRLRRQPPRR